MHTSPVSIKFQIVSTTTLYILSSRMYYVHAYIKKTSFKHTVIYIHLFGNIFINRTIQINVITTTTRRTKIQLLHARLTCVSKRSLSTLSLP